jgi:hypothetical protein
MATAETGQSRRRPRERKSEGQVMPESELNSSTSSSSQSQGWQTSPPGRGDDARGSGRGLGEELRQLVRERTYEQIDSQKQRATSNLGTLAGAVRSMTQPLRDNGQSGLADYVTRAADEIDRWSSQLKERNLDDAVRDVQNFARRRPAVFIGVAFGAGMLAARFLKSTGEARRDEASWQPSSSSFGTVDQRSVAHDTSGIQPAPASSEEL